ncbi:hypothetical protein G7Y89_g12659 [Cudoniella acicularis]|uniref:Uncharacterized protein n=1 Tax=Cudoniella acicularis TaxID=354080 RepID=A0A8H4RC67_9HELO|nr:hypothetical protein G7Y89_g12659 [Cudoniella acicularis]
MLLLVNGNIRDPEEAWRRERRFITTARVFQWQHTRMCGGGRADSPPRESVRLHTLEPEQEQSRRPESHRMPSRSGTRQENRPASKKHTDRPPSSRAQSSQQGGSRPHSSRRSERPSSSTGKRRPSTSGPSPHNDDRPSSSTRRRPSSSQETSSKRYDSSQRHARFDAIPEDAIQYPEDQAIIRSATELFTLTDQHAENFYFKDEHIGEDAELDDPRTRHAVIRQRIAQRIIEDVVRRKRSSTDLGNIAASLSAEFRSYAFANHDAQREGHLFELCKIGLELRNQMERHPADWGFGDWDSRGPRSGYIMLFPTLLKDDEQAAARRLFQL